MFHPFIFRTHGTRELITGSVSGSRRESIARARESTLKAHNFSAKVIREVDRNDCYQGCRTIVCDLDARESHPSNCISSDQAKIIRLTMSESRLLGGKAEQAHLYVWMFARDFLISIRVRSVSCLCGTSGQWSYVSVTSINENLCSSVSAAARYPQSSESAERAILVKPPVCQRQMFRSSTLTELGHEQDISQFACAGGTAPPYTRTMMRSHFDYSDSRCSSSRLGPKSRMSTIAVSCRSYRSNRITSTRRSG